LLKCTCDMMGTVLGEMTIASVYWVYKNRFYYYPVHQVMRKPRLSHNKSRAISRSAVDRWWWFKHMHFPGLCTVHFAKKSSFALPQPLWWASLLISLCLAPASLKLYILVEAAKMGPSLMLPTRLPCSLFLYYLTVCTSTMTLDRCNISEISCITSWSQIFLSLCTT
jgi:hypothetical protein